MAQQKGERSAVRTAMGVAILVLIAVSIVLPSFVSLPTTLFSPYIDEMLGEGLFAAFFGGFLIHGLCTGEMVTLLWRLDFGRDSIDRAEDPWAYWFVTAIYGLLSGAGVYFLIKTFLGH